MVGGWWWGVVCLARRRHYGAFKQQEHSKILFVLFDFVGRVLTVRGPAIMSARQQMGGRAEAKTSAGSTEGRSRANGKK